eukprot:1161380-Pelagomonas_calceolata.AAC.15
MQPPCPWILVKNSISYASVDSRTESHAACNESLPTMQIITCWQCWSSTQTSDTAADMGPGRRDCTPSQELTHTAFFCRDSTPSIKAGECLPVMPCQRSSISTPRLVLRWLKGAVHTPQGPSSRACPPHAGAAHCGAPPAHPTWWQRQSPPA